MGSVPGDQEGQGPGRAGTRRDGDSLPSLGPCGCCCSSWDGMSGIQPLSAAHLPTLATTEQRRPSGTREIPKVRKPRQDQKPCPSLGGDEETLKKDSSCRCFDHHCPQDLPPSREEKPRQRQGARGRDPIQHIPGGMEVPQSVIPALPK
ncbi:hypothetical protein DV515_00016532 [Chloebia gouldiae]|uniref:Uncharacterized protein n=1 Tax=Chloebia gouldiae TaxID=44316 RepID=A0A3L8RTS9_CHLGU|nr:hypothetical protein DV515_00016532 [Chloebia gouldiae]